MTSDDRRREADSIREQFATLLKQVCDIEINIAEINVKLENIHSAKNKNHDEIMELMSKVNHTLYGNGQIGVTGILYNHGEDIKKIDSRVEKQETKLAWCVGICILVVGFAEAAKFLLPLFIK